jgi:uncharacterized membrane protein YidH (DUF202 family)
MIEKTQAIQAFKAQIPEESREERIRELERANRTGLGFMAAAAAVFLLGAYVVVTTELTLTALFVILIAVFLAMHGSNMYSRKYSKAAAETAVGVVKRLAGLRNG